MALQKNMTLKNNFNEESVIKNAYIQIYEISGGKLNLNVKYFIKQENKVNVVDKRSFDFLPSVENNSANFIAQAYNHLKTLPEFDGAFNC
jgi:hypothetical protein